MCYLSEKEYTMAEETDKNKKSDENPNLDRTEQRLKAKKVFKDKDKYSEGSHVKNRNSYSPGDVDNPDAEVPLLDRRKKKEQNLEENENEDPSFDQDDKE